MIWKIGKASSTVVSDEKVKNTNFPVPPNREESEDAEHEYYGGYLVCESIGNRDHAKLIAAAPELLEACKNLENDDGAIPEHAWKLIQDAIKKATL